MRLFLGKGLDFWIISISKFLNINDCSLFLEIVIYVLKNRLDFWDDWHCDDDLIKYSSEDNQHLEYLKKDRVIEIWIEVENDAKTN